MKYSLLFFRATLFLFFFFFLILVNSFNRTALASCIEQNLAKFYLDGRLVPPVEIVGAAICDNFGGVIIYTPKYNMKIYVNFNIAVTIDLNEMESSLEESCSNSATCLKWFNSRSYVFRDSISMNKWYGENTLAIYGVSDASLIFISDLVVSKNIAFKRLWKLIFHDNFYHLKLR